MEVALDSEPFRESMGTRFALLVQTGVTIAAAWRYRPPMTARALAWLAFGLMASGIILGFIKLDVGSVKCGTLFTGEPDHGSSVVEGFGDSSDDASAASGAVADAACSQQRVDQWRTAVPLMVVGVFLGIGAAHTSGSESKREED